MTELPKGQQNALQVEFRFSGPFLFWLFGMLPQRLLQTRRQEPFSMRRRRNWRRFSLVWGYGGILKSSGRDGISLAWLRFLHGLTHTEILAHCFGWQHEAVKTILVVRRQWLLTKLVIVTYHKEVGKIGQCWLLVFKTTLQPRPASSTTSYFKWPLDAPLEFCLQELGVNS